MVVSVDFKYKGLLLVVDDNPENLQLLFQYLKNTGYKVLVAESGEIAIQTLQSVSPNLILLDIKMAGLDGFETCRYLKNNPTTKDIPIIFMTGLSDTLSKVEAFNLGAIDYVTKPINREELLARIQTHLKLQKLNQRVIIQAREEKLLFQLSKRIRQSLNIETILKTAAREIREFLDCDRVLIACLNS